MLKIRFGYLFLISIICLIGSLHCLEYHVKLSSDTPIVRGANATFTSKLFYGDAPAEGKFSYYWEDDASPNRNTRSVEGSNSSVDMWTVHYDVSTRPGPYLIQIKVEKCFLFCREIAQETLMFDITDTLKGKAELIQKNKTRPNDYVSSKDTVSHFIALTKPDLEFVNKPRAEFKNKTPEVLTYWFVDCAYYGVVKGMTFELNYTVPEQRHSVEALMVVDFDPYVPEPTTTTTTTTTTTSTTTTSTAAPSSSTTTKATSTSAVSTTISTTTATSVEKVVKRRSADAKEPVQQRIMIMQNGTLVPYNETFPFVCNGTKVAMDNKKTYGFFKHDIIPKAPITTVNISGDYWLPFGDILHLNVLCDGSQTLKYCVHYIPGLYNITGNETCEVYYQLDSCNFIVQRLLMDVHTMVLIIENDVSKVIKPVTITIYKVTKQAQLSIVVVPVTFCSVAIVLIIFGIAYYIQSRSRFVVEVADFNFGLDYADMEYKTFRERLRESLAHTFTRPRSPSPDNSEAHWPPGPDRKYGSMS